MNSALFPDIDPETYQTAEDLAHGYSTATVTFTVDDMLCALFMSRTISDSVASASSPSKAVRALAKADPKMVRALAFAGRTLQRIRQDGETRPKPRPIGEDLTALTQALMTVIGVASTGKRFGKPPK